MTTSRRDRRSTAVLALLAGLAAAVAWFGAPPAASGTADGDRVVAGAYDPNGSYALNGAYDPN
jgi:hypothetical protein